MAPGATSTQALLAWLAVGLAALGLALHGFSADIHERIWRDIAARPTGPMAFRFVLQPCMAAGAAFRDAAMDARRARSARSVSTGGSPLRETVVATARILLLGLAMDAIHQASVLKTFYPGEMVVVAIMLAFVPYALLRGPFARLARWCARSAPSPDGRDRP